MDQLDCNPVVQSLLRCQSWSEKNLEPSSLELLELLVLQLPTFETTVSL